MIVGIRGVSGHEVPRHQAQTNGQQAVAIQTNVKTSWNITTEVAQMVHKTPPIRVQTSNTIRAIQTQDRTRRHGLFTTTMNAKDSGNQTMKSSQPAIAHIGT